jgi:hypothetical protein
VVTAAALFGAIYKVPAPTVYAPYTAVVVLLIGLVAGMMPEAPSTLADF